MKAEQSTAVPQASMRLGPWQLVVLAAPLLWAVLAILHPTEGGELYAGIADDANKWILVHFGQLLLTPLVAVGVWMLVDGIQSIFATVARAALVLWMVFFSAFDAIAGIATGVLARHANSLPEQQRQDVVQAINFLFDDSQLVGGSNFSILANIGQDTWVVLAIAATLALWRAGASRLVVGATLLSVLFATHGGYVAAVGMIALFVAELMTFSGRQSRKALEGLPAGA